jgi:hypothetical protein
VFSETTFSDDKVAETAAEDDMIASVGLKTLF